MIVRKADNGVLLLITQPEHASLSAAIVSGWDDSAFSPPALRDTVLVAIREHDNGWREIDALPTLNPDTRRPYDFMSAPLEFKHDIWPRGVERLASTSALAAALIAQHGLTVHGHRRGDATWNGFFQTLTGLREQYLAACGSQSGAGRRAFEQNYSLLYLGDVLSLIFCNQWTDPLEAHGYRLAREDDAVLVSPDPFGGREIPFEVLARAIPDRDYDSDDDLRAAYFAGTTVRLTGSAGGPHDAERRR